MVEDAIYRICGLGFKLDLNVGAGRGTDAVADPEYMAPDHSD